jgi:hypothetical protein
MRILSRYNLRSKQQVLFPTASLPIRIPYIYWRDQGRTDRRGSLAFDGTQPQGQITLAAKQLDRLRRPLSTFDLAAQEPYFEKDAYLASYRTPVSFHRLLGNAHVQ